MSDKEEIQKKLSDTSLKSTVGSVDLKDYSFEQDGTRAVLQNDSERFFLSPLAAEQLCKRLRIPAKFISHNPVRLNVEIFKEWLPKLKESKADILTVQDSEGNTVIRGFMNFEVPKLSYAQFWNIVKDQFIEDGKGAVIEFAGGGLESSCFAVRIALAGDLTFKGHQYRPMVEIMHSDIGYTPRLTVDMGFINLTNFTGFMVRTDKGKPQQEWNYKKGVEADEFKAYLETVPKKLADSWANSLVTFNAMDTKVYSGQELYDLLGDISNRKGFNSPNIKKIRNSMFVTKEGADGPEFSDSQSMFGIAKMMCDALAEKPTFQRYRIESSAAKLLGLEII